MVGSLIHALSKRFTRNNINKKNLKHWPFSLSFAKRHHGVATHSKKQGWFWPEEKLATNRSARKHSGGRADFGARHRPPKGFVGQG